LNQEEATDHYFADALVSIASRRYMSRLTPVVPSSVHDARLYLQHAKSQLVAGLRSRIIGQMSECGGVFLQRNVNYSERGDHEWDEYFWPAP
jgi:hypothetical protein